MWNLLALHVYIINIQRFFRFVNRILEFTHSNIREESIKRGSGEGSPFGHVIILRLLFDCDFDCFGFGFFHFGHVYGEDAVVEFRFHFIGIYAVG